MEYAKNAATANTDELTQPTVIKPAMETENFFTNW